MQELRYKEDFEKELTALKRKYMCCLEKNGREEVIAEIRNLRLAYASLYPLGSQMQREIFSFERNHYKSNYREWLAESQNREIIEINTNASDRPYKCLNRPYGFVSAINFGDPITEDERDYLIKFARNLTPEKEIKSLTDIRIHIVRLGFRKLFGDQATRI